MHNFTFITLQITGRVFALATADNGLIVWSWVTKNNSILETEETVFESLKVDYRSCYWEKEMNRSSPVYPFYGRYM